MTESYKPTPAASANSSNSVTHLLSSQDGADRQHVRPPVQETQDDVDASDDHLDLDGPTSFLGDSDGLAQVIIEQPPTSIHKHVARELDKGSDDSRGGYVAACMQYIPDDPTLSPLTTGRKAENARDSPDINSPYRSFPENCTLTSLMTRTNFHGQSASGFSSVGMNQPSGGHLRNLDSELRPSSQATSSEVNTENLDLAELKSHLAHSNPLVSCKTAHDITPAVRDLARTSDDINEGLAAALYHIDIDSPQRSLNTTMQTGTNQSSSGAIYPPRSPPCNLDNLRTKPIKTGSSSPNQSTSGNSSDGMRQHSRSRLRNPDSETLNSLRGDSNDPQLTSSPHSIRPRAEHTKDVADDDIVSRLSEYQTAESDQSSSLQSVDLMSKIQDRIRTIEQAIETDSLMEYPQYANLRIRHQTFKTWPSSSSQCPRKLARAGFFYLGIKDHCRCYYCGNLLRDWKLGDDPETEHELWFPDCPFVLLTRRNTIIGCNERLDHKANDSINNGVRGLPYQEEDHALYPHIDPYICGVCGVREIGATQLYCMHIVCRKCVPVPDENGKAWCRICGKEVVKTVAYDSSFRSICQYRL